MVEVFANEYISREVAGAFDNVSVDKVDYLQLNAQCRIDTTICGVFAEDFVYHW